MSHPQQQKTRMKSHAQLLIQVGNLRDSVVWLVEHQMVRHGTCFLFPVVSLLGWQAFLSVSLFCQALTSLASHSSELPRKAAQKAARALKNVLINVEVFSAFQKVLSEATTQSLGAPHASLPQQVGSHFTRCCGLSLVMVTRIPAWNSFRKSSLQIC